MKRAWKGRVLAAAAVLIVASAVWADPAPPASPVRLVFIHHSTGGNWLADVGDGPYGGLGMALMNNNYYVSATNYGWGPDGIGDRTDIYNWPEWFTGENSATHLSALYAESGQNEPGPNGDSFGSWSRLPTPPAGENRIILFKSCFPNSDLDGNPGDPPASEISYDLTVANAKAVYNSLLAYFQTRPDKLFIVITAPPLMASETSAGHAANARAFNSWLVEEWLDGYAQHNVAVFDYYNVLTAPGNHHRWNNNAVEHVIQTRSNTAYYPTEDSHPNAAGQQKAASEFVPLLNYWYQQWQSSGGSTVPLYFPHVATTDSWQTEIAVVNAGDQAVTGTLKAYSNAGGSPVETKAVTLNPHGRRQINVVSEFTHHASIGYIVFETTSGTVRGYTKFYKGGYRVAIPAVREVNTSDIYITHIASDAEWWTGISLVNTTAAVKTVTLDFSDGQSKEVTLAAHEHRAFAVKDLFNDVPQPSIKSAVITNAGGLIGLELFATYNEQQMEGILLTDRTATSLYYPYVLNNAVWWTGIVAYNPSSSPCDITVTSYHANGSYLASPTDTIPGREKYIGTSDQLGLPAQTAWFRIDATGNLSGFELIGTRALDRLASYAGNGGAGSRAGVFGKIEKQGWTTLSLVNTENSTATVTLTAYSDDGTSVSSRQITLAAHAAMIDAAANFFPQSIADATYATYTSDRDMAGLQLNYSADGTMLDGLPGR